MNTLYAAAHAHRKVADDVVAFFVWMRRRHGLDLKVQRRPPSVDDLSVYRLLSLCHRRYDLAEGSSQMIVDGSAVHRSEASVDPNEPELPVQKTKAQRGLAVQRLKFREVTE